MKKETFEDFWETRLQPLHRKIYRTLIHLKAFGDQKKNPNDVDFFKQTVDSYQSESRDKLFKIYSERKDILKKWLYGSGANKNQIKLDQHKIAALFGFSSLDPNFWEISHEDGSRFMNLIREEFAFHVSNQVIVSYDNCHFLYLNEKNHPHTYGTKLPYKVEVIRYFQLYRKSKFNFSNTQDEALLSMLLKMEAFQKYYFESFVTRKSLEI